MTRRLIVLTFALISFLPVSGGASKDEQDPKKSAVQGAFVASSPVVARVQGEAITEKQVLDTINQYVSQLASAQQATQEQVQQKDTLFFKNALDTLIGTILLKNEAKQNNMVADKAKVDATLQSMKSKFPSEAQFRQALQMQGMSEADLRSSLETNILCQMMIDQISKNVPPPTEAEIQKFYTENPKYFEQPEQYHAAQIFLRVNSADATAEQKAEARKRLEAIRADVESKKITFADAAAKNSDDKLSAATGGDLGMLKHGDMVKPLEDAILATKPGALSPIVETEYGYHLFNVIEIKPAGTAPLQDVKAKIVEFLERQAKQEATRKHLEGLQAKANIEIVMSQEEWNKRHAAK